MVWAVFMAQSLCKWAKKEIGATKVFGGESEFEYDERWPNQVPVFENRTFIFTDSNHEIRLALDDLDYSREIFLRLRDLYYKPMPGMPQPEGRFKIDMGQYKNLLENIEYSQGPLIMTARLTQEVYREFSRTNQKVFETLNNISIRSILGAMYNFEKQREKSQEIAST